MKLKELPRGESLAVAIKEMGLNPTAFAKLAGLSQTAIVNWINNPKVVPEPEPKAKALAVLNKRCRCCQQYTEKKDAWDNSSAESESGGRARKA